MKRIKESYGFLILRSMLFSAVSLVAGHIACKEFRTKYGSEVAMISIFEIAILVVFAYQLIAVIIMLYVPVDKYKYQPKKNSVIIISTIILPLWSCNI